MTEALLVVNSGSSSVKFAAYDAVHTEGSGDDAALIAADLLARRRAERVSTAGA